MLNINLTNGVYWLGYESATGKTRMKCLMEVENEIDRKYLYISQDDNIDELELLKSKVEIYDIIFIDRFDMYYSKEFIDFLNLIYDSKIILLDVKDYYLLNMIKYSDAMIQLTKDGVVVDELEDYI